MRHFLFVLLTLALAGGATTPALIGTASADLGNTFTKISTPGDPGTPDGREGGETVDDAFVIAALPFADTGNTSDNLHDYDEACPYTGSLSPDVVYAFTPTHDCFVIIDLCESLYDTKVYVYENVVTPGTPYACNDDSADCNTLYRSMIESLGLAGGNTYYIVIDGYSGDMGDYILMVADIPMPPPPCELECPAGGVDEGEPPLVDGYSDQYNGGCGSTPWIFQLLDYSTLCGISGWYLQGGADGRDTDWFTCIADEDGFITASAYAEFDLYLFVLWPTDCNAVGVVYDVICECYEPGIIEFAHPAGTEAWLWCGPTEYTGPVYEFDYILTVDGIELNEPSAIGQNSWGGIKSMFME